MRKVGKGNGSGLGMTGTGLVPMRIGLPVTRRDFGKGAPGAAAAGGMGLHAGKARAGTGVNYMGWNGYDLVPNAGGFLHPAPGIDYGDTDFRHDDVGVIRDVAADDRRPATGRGRADRL